MEINRWVGRQTDTQTSLIVGKHQAAKGSKSLYLGDNY